MVHGYTNKAFANTPVLTVAALPGIATEGEIRLVLSEDAIFQYLSGSWINTGIMGTGSFFADGSVPAKGDWNIAGFDLLNLGQLTSASAQGFDLLSRVTNGPTAVVFGIDTVNAITNAAARLFSIKVMGVEKFAISPTGDVVVGGGISSSGNSDILLDVDNNDLTEKFTVYHNVAVPTPGNELFQVRANGEVEIYGGPLIGGSSPFKFKSKEANGASAIAFEFDTQNVLSTAGAKLFSIKNNGTEFMVVDKDGDLNIVGDYIVNRTPTNDDITSSGEHIIGVTDTTYPRTVTLSMADALDGKKTIIKDESGAASTGTITIVCEGSGQTIDGELSVEITADFGVIRLYSNGFNWFSY